MFSNIQMLRAVAATMVLVHHAAPHYQAMGGGWTFFVGFGAIGFSGVDIFFVISGFVAAHTTLGKPRTLSHAWNFARRRLLRIYLGYWPFFFLALAITAVAFPAAMAEIDLLGSFLLTRIELKRLVLYVTWSLTFELLFYAIVTASFALTVQKVKILAHACGAVILSLLIWTYGTPHSDGLLFLSMLLEFLAGVLVYIHRDKLASRWWIVPCVLTAALAFAFGARVHATDGSVRIFAFGTGALALVVLALALEMSRIFIANRFWVALGDSSYSLYLVHLPLVMLFYLVGVRQYLAGQPAFWREAGFFAYLGLCLAIGHVFFVRVEGPVYRWASATRGGSTRPSNEKAA